MFKNAMKRNKFLSLLLLSGVMAAPEFKTFAMEQNTAAQAAQNRKELAENISKTASQKAEKLTNALKNNESQNIMVYGLGMSGQVKSILTTLNRFVNTVNDAESSAEVAINKSKQLESSLKKAQEELKKAQEGLKEKEGEQKAQEERLKTAQSDLTKAKSDLTKAQSDLTKAQSELKNTNDMVVLLQEELVDKKKTDQNGNQLLKVKNQEKQPVQQENADQNADYQPPQEDQENQEEKKEENQPQQRQKIEKSNLEQVLGELFSLVQNQESLNGKGGPEKRRKLSDLVLQKIDQIDGDGSKELYEYLTGSDKDGKTVLPKKHDVQDLLNALNKKIDKSYEEDLL
jgi:myosin heavy subunit